MLLAARLGLSPDYCDSVGESDSRIIATVGLDPYFFTLFVFVSKHHFLLGVLFICDMF
jgi:hypothetical protein